MTKRDRAGRLSPWLAGLVAALFWGATVRPGLAETIYVVERRNGELRVTLEHPHRSRATALVLRGVGFGVAPQVQAPSCDGTLLMSAGEGRWAVPAGCRHISWAVPLDPSGRTPASAQRSLAMASGIFLSEASSLPRLADADPVELLRLPPGSAFPATKDGVLPMPKPTQAPLFVLLGAQPLDRRTAENTELVYFIDDPAARGRLPDIATHLAGLRWLRDRYPSDVAMTFAVLWLGAPRELLSLGGAKGAELLIANYLAGADAKPLEKALRLYVPLHEAVHQLGEGGQRPVWMEESLASYFGVRAALAATNDASEMTALFERFRNDAGKFQEGLLISSHRVEAGDRAGYAAFYTKGLAFWDAVNTAMGLAGDRLDRHLQSLLDAKFESEAHMPERLRAMLGLSHETWERLRKQYLD